MTEFQKKLFDEIGVNGGALPQDFGATLHYLLEANADRRNARMFLKRYSNDESIEAIGKEFDVTRQRADVIVKDVRNMLLKPQNKEMLKFGLKAYVEIAVQRRVDELKNVLSDKERDAIHREAYDKGYKNGLKDKATGRSDNKADMDIVRNIRVATLPFSVRCTNIFEKHDINTLGDLVDMGDKLKNIRGFGKTSFIEICARLRKLNVDVNTIFPRTIEFFKLHYED